MAKISWAGYKKFISEGRGRFFFLLLPIIAVSLLLELGIVYRYLGGIMEQEILDDAINRTEATADQVAGWLEKRNLELNWTGVGDTAKLLLDSAGEEPLSVTETVEALWFGDHGFSILIAGDGRFVVGSEPEIAGSANIFNHPDPAMQDLGRRMRSSKAGFCQLRLRDGADVLAIHYPISGTDWSLATVSPMDELFAPLHSAMNMLVALSLMLALLTSFVLTCALKNFGQLQQEIAATLASSPSSQAASPTPAAQAAWDASMREHLEAVDDIAKAGRVIAEMANRLQRSSQKFRAWEGKT